MTVPDMTLQVGQNPVGVNSAVASAGTHLDGLCGPVVSTSGDAAFLSRQGPSFYLF